MADTSGQCTVVENLTSNTLISSLKALIKAPETARIQFSPAFTSNFGASLADDRTLGCCGVLGRTAKPTQRLASHDCPAHACSQMATFCTTRAANLWCPLPAARPRLHQPRKRSDRWLLGCPRARQRS